MTLAAQIAQHFRAVYFGGNWTAVNLRDKLADITWQQAITKVHDFNTIAVLVYHMNYFVKAAITVLEGAPLTAKDIYSFDLPPILNPSDWDSLRNILWRDAEMLAVMVERMPDDEIFANFYDGKYGNNYRNIHGIIEHNHYHLGQISLIKKLLTTVKDE